MRKSDVEKLEQAVWSLSERDYWRFVGWLSNGKQGDLWECLRRRQVRQQDQE
jgi:hypothetical protein